MIQLIYYVLNEISGILINCIHDTAYIAYILCIEENISNHNSFC